MSRDDEKRDPAEDAPGGELHEDELKDVTGGMYIEPPDGSGSAPQEII